VDLMRRHAHRISLTIVMWEVITGRIPYAGITPDRITQMVPIGKRLAIPPETPQKVRELIEHGWHQDPAKRPTCQQMMVAIKSVMQAITSNPVMTASSPSPSLSPVVASIVSVSSPIAPVSRHAVLGGVSPPGLEELIRVDESGIVSLCVDDVKLWPSQQVEVEQAIARNTPSQNGRMLRSDS
jgi:hypothetical protein